MGPRGMRMGSGGGSTMKNFIVCTVQLNRESFIIRTPRCSAGGTMEIYITHTGTHTHKQHISYKVNGATNFKLALINILLEYIHKLYISKHCKFNSHILYNYLCAPPVSMVTSLNINREQYPFSTFCPLFSSEEAPEFY